MRIIAGRFGGRTLHSPQGHATRPSTARTRESLFGLIDSRIYLDGAEVLDLFAGTGALGLEAISRGAALVTFVEEQGDVLDYARRNARELGVEDQCFFVQGDAVTYLERYGGTPLDLVMADPPYKLDAMRRLPDLAIPHLNNDGVFTLEHSSHHFFDEHPRLMTSRAYGRTIVSLFRPALEPPAGEEQPADEETPADEEGPAAEEVPAGDEPATGDRAPADEDAAPESATPSGAEAGSSRSEPAS
jgi:16S rRNA (guanine966-N2)-methyltransferase